MKKEYLILISFPILLAAIFGCSAKQEQFSDENIIFNVVKTESTEGFNIYN
ncbi:hypothetical protein [Oceanobacillus damuensis]|uniref:hypothetical protein n=1 Tax=Oceanobacillus damuensis TaxID=937928 RepID=UPI000AD6FC86|nr:hypothetical protein [Oceanobacillus damuensis]